MKIFNTLSHADNIWILSYTENGVGEEYTTTSLDDIKTKCAEYNFHLDFTGALNGSNQ
jgi:hypothetical protein